MTQEKNNVGHPYDWIDPQAEYWATHKPRTLPPDYVIYDADKIDPALLKKEIRPGDIYWRKEEPPIPADYIDELMYRQRMIAETEMEIAKCEVEIKVQQEYAAKDRYRRDVLENPWINGRHALAALVWGLIVMVTISAWVGS